MDDYLERIEENMLTRFRSIACSKNKLCYAASEEELRSELRAVIEASAEIEKMLKMYIRECIDHGN